MQRSCTGCRYFFCFYWPLFYSNCFVTAFFSRFGTKLLCWWIKIQATDQCQHVNDFLFHNNGFGLFAYKEINYKYFPICYIGLIPLIPSPCFSAVGGSQWRRRDGAALQIPTSSPHLPSSSPKEKRRCSIANPNFITTTSTLYLCSTFSKTPS